MENSAGDIPCSSKAVTENVFSQFQHLEADTAMIQEAQAPSQYHPDGTILQTQEMED